jgi:hypothetical protein
MLTALSKTLLYSSPDTGVIKSRRRLAGHVAATGERRGAYRTFGEET